MNSAQVLEMAGDNFFVIASVLGSIAVIVWLFVRINKKAKGRV
ncbi:EYxxD motif small membrane protein [Ammoniphilus sp. CFH 90114]|nr:EYxxD motif small membrane protein [Ammoniphilus sp. CFH 90114]